MKKLVLASGLLSFLALAVHAAEWDPGIRWTAWSLMEEDFDQAAAELYGDILGKDARFAFDRLNRARCLVDLARDDEATDLLDQAAAIDAEYPHLPYMKGLIQRRRGELIPARESFQKALSLDGRLVEAQFQLGLIEENENRLEQARTAYERVLAMLDGPAKGAMPAASALKVRFLAHKHLSLVHSFAGNEAESGRHYDLAMVHAGDSPAQDTDLDAGPSLAPLHPGAPAIARELAREGITRAPSAEVAFPPFARAPLPLPGAADVISVTDVSSTTAGPALWAVGTSLGTLLVEAGGTVPRATFPEERVAAVADLTGDGVRELVLSRPDGRLQVTGIASTSATSAPASHTLETQGPGPVVASDLDHDGDLDLLAAGSQGGKPGLWFHLNRAPPGPGPALALAAVADCGVTTGTSSVALSLLARDLDDDGAADVVAIVPAEPPLAWLGQRQCRFARATFPAPAATGPGTLADLDGDGRLDLAYLTASGLVVLRRTGAAPTGGSVTPVTPPASPLPAGGGGPGSNGSAPGAIGALAPGLHFSLEPIPIPGPAPRALAAADLGGTPLPELVIDLGDGRFQILENRTPTPDAPLSFHPADLPADLRLPATAPAPTIGDFDHDGDRDLLLAGGEYLRNDGPAGACALRLSLRGNAGKVPFHGTGSRVTARAGGRLVRLDVTAPTELLTLGNAGQADLVRIAWTDGTIQNLLAPVDVPPSRRTAVACGSALEIAQKAGLGGSCPYLYVDDGGTWTFVTDVLAGSPLGLPSPAGGYVPTVPVELVTLPTRFVPAADGMLRVRVTEEYREVTYLDEVELLSIEHPPGWTVFPTPAGHEPGYLAFPVLTPPERARLLPASATSPPVAAPPVPDLASTLADADGVTFVPPRTAVQGVAPAHTIELEFPAAPGRPWLVLEGLVYWTDAGINTALAQSDPRLSYPPALEVPDDRGGWRRALFPVPFPAGRHKAVAVDLSAHLPEGARATLRLTTTMRFFWDRIALARAPAPDAPSPTVRRVRPAAARVAPAGFARLGPDPGEPPWTLDTRHPSTDLEASWIAPRGLYTAHGPLERQLDAFDDHYVVLGPGDGTEITFHAPPVPPGASRTLALRLAGYCKDAHPATYASASVEPWPSRAMPSYEPGTTWPAAGQQRLRERHAPTTTRPRAGPGASRPPPTTR